MYVDEYIVIKGSRLFKGGRQIPSTQIHIECTKEQQEILVKNKTIKKKKGESNGSESKATKTED
jgi:hypothetical protein